MDMMIWGPISLMGFFCTLVFLGFSLLSLLSVFTKKGSFLNSIVGVLLSGMFFAVFAFGAVKVQQYNEMAGDKPGPNPIAITQTQTSVKK
ncbi:hypothetical protein [Aneurinibacillus danicus]|uniref:Uncharacterized protein n=1 Tax=Aneurinibacillus danicus TaxID=267746 RepID=A0A511VAQ2_9BACL|nr:hypothetical protein [Aneurinibacillus danicus]GEN34643.1 hypothetical protein ADA01nite_21030 [Aneurinibacillus danicus]